MASDPDRSDRYHERKKSDYSFTPPAPVKIPNPYFAQFLPQAVFMVLHCPHDDYADKDANIVKD
jgi:hypothetical protein